MLKLHGSVSSLFAAPVTIYTRAMFLSLATHTRCISRVGPVMGTANIYNDSNRIPLPQWRSYSTNPIDKKSTHFFTPIPRNDTPQTTQDNKSSALAAANAINEYRRQKTRRALRNTVIAIGILIMGGLGYQIGYKVLYLQQESFLPLCPSLHVHKLNRYELEHIDVAYLEKLVRVKVMERILLNDFIMREYGVPLKLSFDLEGNHHGDNGGVNGATVDEFKVWGENDGPVILGIKFRPDNGRISGYINGGSSIENVWHRIPYVLKWRLARKSVDVTKNVDEFLENIGAKGDRIGVSPAMPNSFGPFDSRRYNKSVRDLGIIRRDHEGGEEDDLPVRICFAGVMYFNGDSKVVYKGQYHVDIRFDEISLLRKEGDKLVEYILYKK